MNDADLGEAIALATELLKEPRALKTDKAQQLAEAVSHLRARRDELLALTVKIANETPYSDEARDALDQRGSLLAEIGTLRAENLELRMAAQDAPTATYARPSERPLSAALAGWLVRPYLGRRPLPWHVEQDWTMEVTDAKGHVVIKLPDGGSANELLTFASDLAVRDEAARIEMNKLFPDIADIDDGESA